MGTLTLLYRREIWRSHPGWTNLFATPSVLGTQSTSYSAFRELGRAKTASITKSPAATPAEIWPITLVPIKS